VAEARHGYLKTTEGIHIPYQWAFDSASARENASGLTSDDEGKLARQTNDDSLWLLVDASAVSWVQVGAGASSIQGYAVSGSAPFDWDRLVWSASASEWTPTASPDTASAFIELSDTPNLYTGYSGSLLAVNSAETGLEYVSDQDHGVLGAYDIEQGGHTDAGMGDEFSASTLDPKWTAVGMTASTVSLLRTASGNIFDLSTRQGVLLIQVSSGSGQALLRQDAVPADSEQILVSFSVPTPFSSTAIRMITGVNADDAAHDSGSAEYIYVDSWHRGGRFYTRLVRASGSVLFFVSTDGVVWSPVSQTTWNASWSNFWVGVAVTGSFSGPQPICAIQWVRHVSNINLDPW